MRVLVTGGAGYIGAHVVRALCARDADVVVVDDLSTGVAARVAGHPLERLDLASAGARAALAAILRDRRVDAVVHLAALKSVEESVAEPLRYYGANLDSLRAVLGAMTDAEVHSLVFSSSAAVYGEVGGTATEQTPPSPSNPYGETKLIGEWMTDRVARSTGIRAISLRYFNVAGAATPDLAERAATNLIPLVIERLRRGEAPRIFGDEYPTRDGTCVRDFVHVEDLADAHLVALSALAGSSAPHRVFNVGTGTGTSVLEVVEGLRARATGAPQAQVLPPRPGDPATVVADAGLIERELGWRASRHLDRILDDAWRTAPA